MYGGDEARTIRNRQAGLAAQIDRAPTAYGEPAPTQVVQPYTKTAYPTAAQSWFACRPVDVSGTEAEGNPPTLTPDTSRTIYALNVGSAVPPTGSTYVLATYVTTPTGSYWTFNYRG